VRRESVKASAFYSSRGRRGRRRLQWPAMKAPVTVVKRGGVYGRVKAHNRVKEGGGRVHYGAPWRGRGAARRQRRDGASGGGGAAGLLREEGEGGWLGLPGRSGPGGLARPLG
jgi:hypothetical protein